jgi:hypothetical protein
MEDASAILLSIKIPLTLLAKLALILVILAMALLQAIV